MHHIYFICILYTILNVISPCFAIGGSSNIQIENGGYSGIVIAINSQIEESEDLIDAIKETWTNASRDLYVATKNMAYFKEITILLPESWDKIDRNPSTGNEAYDRADVIIAPENPSYGSSPYTVQYGGCGQRGMYSHYPPTFIQDDSSVNDYGPRGKVVVHEWAHFRWGVFDETSNEFPFYWDPNYDGSNGPEATRCPATVFGEVRNISTNNAEKPCTLLDIDPTTDSFPYNCVYFPYEEQYYHPNASLMSYHYMDEVSTFCEDAGETPSVNAHNIYAPNDQNRLCNMKSTWTVIMESGDFGNEVNDIKINSTVPVFKVVRPQGQRFVLVLDTSGSMIGDKIVALRKAAYQFITVAVSNGSWVGMIEFCSSAIELSKLKLMDSTKAREDMANLLPTRANGGTCIGCGMQAGINVLEDFGSPAGGYLVVITDGEGSGVDGVYDEVLQKGIIVSTIYIETYANEILSNLSLESGGAWYYTDDGENLQQALSEISTSGDKGSNSFQIQSASFSLIHGELYTGEVFIDKTIGLNTVFVFTWSLNWDPPTINILSPSGCYFTNDPTTSKICDGGKDFETSVDFQTIKFFIPGLAEVGKWVYTVTPSTNDPQSITSSVSSSASGNKIEPIIVDSGMSETTVTGGSATVVYAKVTQGYNPILDAIVEATISRPKDRPVVMYLLDNGAGADIRANDGIYSKYFTQFSGEGRYSVTVKVSYQNTTDSSTRTRAKTSRANYRPGVIASDGDVAINPHGAYPPETNETTTNGIKSEDLGEFSRVVPSGGFSYTEPPAGTPTDSFPPAKIIDMKLQQNDLDDYLKGVIITFTAPGDDFDTGNASFYDIHYTYGDPIELLNNFEGNSNITNDDMIQGNLSSPSVAGTNEEMVIQTPDLPDAAESVRLAFAIRATDDAGNIGDPSNVAVINFFVAPPVPPTTTTIEPTTNVESTTTSTKKTTTSTKKTTTSTKKTTTKPVTKSTTGKVCTQCEVCDPNANLYLILAATLSASTAALLTSTIILSAWLCRSNNDLKKKQKRTNVEGVDNAYSISMEAMSETRFPKARTESPYY